MAGGGQGSGGMGGGQGAGGMGGPVSGTMGGAGGDLGTASYMNKGGFDGGYGGGMGGFGGGYGMGSPFGGFGMGMPGMGYGGGMGGFGMGMGSPFGGYGSGMGGFGGYGMGMGMPYGGYGLGMPFGGYGGGMGGFDGGMKGGFSRGMGSPFRGGMGGIQDRMYRGEPGMVYAGGSPDFDFRGGMGGIQDRMYRGEPGGGMAQIQGGSSRENLDQFNLEQALRSGFLGRAAVMPQQPDQFPPARAAVMPQQNRIPETVGTRGSVPKPPAPDALTGGPAEVINKGMTKPYIEPAAPAAPQVPTVPEAPAMGSRDMVEKVTEGVTKPGTEAMSSYVAPRPFIPSTGVMGKPWKDPRVAAEGEYAAPNPGNNPMGTTPLPRPTSAQQAYDQAMSYYNDPAAIRYYESLAPSTRAFMDDPRDEAKARYRAEQARANYIAYQGRDPFGPRGMKDGGIASLRGYATGGFAKEGDGDGGDGDGGDGDGGGGDGDGGNGDGNNSNDKPYVPVAKPVDISKNYGAYTPPPHTIYTPNRYVIPPERFGAIGRNLPPNILSRNYAVPSRLVKPGMSYREPFLYGPYQSNPKGISGLLK